MWFKKTKTISRACEEWSEVFSPKFLGESTNGLILNLKKTGKQNPKKVNTTPKHVFLPEAKQTKWPIFPAGYEVWP